MPPIVSTTPPPTGVPCPTAAEGYDKGRAGQVRERSSLNASQWSLIGGAALIIAGLIFTVVHLQNKADATRLVQIAIRQVEVHANLISRSEWEATAQRKVTPELSNRLRLAESEMLRTTQTLADKKPSTIVEALDTTCSQYVSGVDHEMVLLRAGQFEQAGRIDDAEVDPKFRRIEELIGLINEEQRQVAEDTVFASRMGLIAAALFSTAMILMYHRRFDIQRHRAELALAERSVAQLNEDRFRTLTEKSADLIMITSPEGEVRYISPSVRTVLGWDSREDSRDQYFRANSS